MVEDEGLIPARINLKTAVHFNAESHGRKGVTQRKVGVVKKSEYDDFSDGVNLHHWVSMVWCCRKEDNFQKTIKHTISHRVPSRLCVKKEPAQLSNLG